jgi:uncharacterized iron-regulated membrane protein
MKTETIRIYKAVHTWTGILSGMALFIAFYAGAMSVFKAPLNRWASPPSVSQSVALAETGELIRQTLSVHPEVARDFTLHLGDSEEVPGRLSWQVRDPQADAHDSFAARHYRAELDAQGLAQVHETHPAQLGEFIDVLHRVVGLPVDNDPNRWLMGVVSVLYTLALVSGVIVLLPSLVKDFFALRLGKNLKRMWLDAHNVVGIISLPFHLVMALTAVVFAFHDEIYVLQDKALHAGKLSAAFQRPPAAAADVPARDKTRDKARDKALDPLRDPAALLPPTQLLQSVRVLAPTFEPTSLQYLNVGGARAMVRVWGKDETAVQPRARGGFVAVDPYSGQIISADLLPGRQSTPGLVISSFFALHMAAFGGVAVQWMYFLLGLAGAWLFYSGNLLWVESRRRKARQDQAFPVQRLDVRLLAAASVGVCLGCVCGISLMIVGSKWLHGVVGDAASWHSRLYYCAFFVSLFWAFLRGAGPAAIHLLWSAAALTLAIPVTTALAWCFPSLGLWAHSSPAALSVDATAFAGAVCFAWMARATAQRVAHGAADSVWSSRAAVHPA